MKRIILFCFTVFSAVLVQASYSPLNNEGNIIDTKSSVCSNFNQSETYQGWSIYYLKDEFGQPYGEPLLVYKPLPCRRNNTFDGKMYIRLNPIYNYIDIGMMEDGSVVFLPEATFSALYNGQKFSSRTECVEDLAHILDENVTKKIINILDSGKGVLQIALTRVDSFGSKQTWVTSIHLPTNCKTAWNILR